MNAEHFQHETVLELDRARTSARSRALAILAWLWMYLAAAFLSGCAHLRPEQGIQESRRALAGIGATFSALSVAYGTAVSARVEVCKRQLPEGASEDDRRRCMGALGSDARIAQDMARFKALYDEGADLLGELETLIVSLTSALKEAKSGQ